MQMKQNIKNQIDFWLDLSPLNLHKTNQTDTHFIGSFELIMIPGER